MRRCRQGVLTLGLAVALLMMLAPAALADSAKMPASLAAFAQAAPDQSVQVIVQKASLTADAEAAVAALGGEVLTPLPIINAFVARLQAGDLAALAAAPSVRWVSPDALVSSAATSTDGIPTENTYLDTTGVRRVWTLGPTGSGVGVAVIDSGITNDPDFTRIGRSVSFNPSATSVNDFYGHGTHVAGIVAGTGKDSAGRYRGVAPGVTLYNLKIADDLGRASESDVVAALQWVYDNRAKFGIRVVNLSVNSGVAQSYHTSPLDAACEILWFNGVVVIASAGNGTAGAYTTLAAAPANDPFIITVGAADEKGTSLTWDDAMAGFSAYGVTGDGFRKPDIVAPGAHIYSVVSNQSSWPDLYPQRVTADGQYFRLSGTSMAAPVVAGTVALLLQDEPSLTPDQVKYRLLSTGRSIAAPDGSTYKYLNAYAAVTGTSTASSNTGTAASQLLWSGSDPVLWGSVMWNSVMWNSVMWNSVMWNSVMWNSVMWNSVNWSSIMWN